MKNADEHAKLLAQLAELERNSVNYFDVEKEFFLIDSNNLHTVRPRLYGYSIQATGIYEDDNLTEEAIKGLNGRGCYVYVEVKDGKITIKQDLNGCWGIYLFRHGDYFALSNSFFRLLDHVKFKYPLTVNRDYCHYLFIEPVSNRAYFETAVNEIQTLERDSIIHIDIVTKSLEFELIDYKEQTVDLDTAEGITTLDRWLEFWGSVLRSIAQHTKFIRTDLSGGFDSRITFLALLNSGLDLKKIHINSIKGTVHTFKEDYSIASQIAAHYGFELNQPLYERQTLNNSLRDTFNLNLYGCQTFSNIPKLWWKKNIDKFYCLDGSGGEAIRNHWHESPSQFIEKQCRNVNPFSINVAHRLSESIKIILESGFRAVCGKYRIEDEASEKIPQLFYREQTRNHFGKGILYGSMNNSVMLSPALDPELRTLKLETSECSDANLLVALLFTRYAPDLLSFPFQGNRSIAPETIEYAKKINERFPICHQNANILTGGGISLTAA